MHKKKATGGIKRPWRGKRAYEAGGEPVETTLGKVKQRRVGIRGGATKIRLASADWAGVTDKSTGKSSKSKLLRGVKNPANVDYQRRGGNTKGAVRGKGLRHGRRSLPPRPKGGLKAALVFPT